MNNRSAYTNQTFPYRIISRLILQREIRWNYGKCRNLSKDLNEKLNFSNNPQYFQLCRWLQCLVFKPFDQNPKPCLRIIVLSQDSESISQRTFFKPKCYWNALTVSKFCPITTRRRPFVGEFFLRLLNICFIQWINTFFHLNFENSYFYIDKII